MKTKHLTILLVILYTTALLLYIIALTSCDLRPDKESEPLTADPILVVGHGAFIGSDGTEVTPNPEFIQQAQKYYIDTLLKAAKAGQAPNDLTDDRIEETQKLIYSLVEDEILANALFVDWLIEKAQPQNIAHLTSVNNALRWYYVLEIQPNPILPTAENEWTKGIPPEIAKELEAAGLTVFLKTNANGAEYRAECREAGVPVPEAMFTSDRNFQGIIDPEFISTSWATSVQPLS